MKKKTKPQPILSPSLLCFEIIFDLLSFIRWIDPTAENRAGGMVGESKAGENPDPL